MIGERLQGVKRKLRDQDVDLQVRCIQRQTVFNISICKLQKNAQRPEPMLCRTVLIENTVRLIQKEIEDESKDVGDAPTSELDNQLGEMGETSAQVPNRFHQHYTRSRECSDNPQSPGALEKELNLLGDKITRNLEILSQEDPPRILTTKQTVSSRPRHDHGQDRGTSRTEGTDRELNCGNLFSLELTEELEFSDVDVSLYDFDVPSFPVDFDEFCGALSVANTAGFASRCCDSMKLERKNEHAFDDLDQVMQILVGS